MNREYIKEWVAEWQRKKTEAMEAGDFKAYSEAEREEANYRQMLAEAGRWEVATWDLV